MQKLGGQKINRLKIATVLYPGWTNNNSKPSQILGRYAQPLFNMRLWSIHPKYMDAKGLVALWRETLLAKHVLEGKTKGYKNHPQLNRFKRSKKPLDSINSYLAVIHQEALSRQYNFDKQKVDWSFLPTSLSVTKGQLKYESVHFLSKIKIRDPKKYKELKILLSFDPHPLFDLIDGDTEEWEIITTRNSIKSVKRGF